MLPDCIEIYNNNIHSTTKYTPAYLFNCNDKNKKNTDNAIKNNSHCLLCSNFDLKGYLIKKKFEKKGQYSIPCIVVGSSGGNLYKIKFPMNY